MKKEVLKSFSWGNIAEQFAFEFRNVFVHGDADKKLHFDCVSDEFKTIDGGKEKWCTLLLLDAVISILSTDVFDVSNRRAFKQQIVLYECVMNELKLIDEQCFNEVMTDKQYISLKSTKKLNPQQVFEEKIAKYSHFSLTDLNLPWDSIDSLLFSFAQDSPASKAKLKYATIVELLTTHEELSKYEYNMEIIIQLVITKILFALNSNSNKSRSTNKITFQRFYYNHTSHMSINTLQTQIFMQVINNDSDSTLTYKNLHRGDNNKNNSTQTTNKRVRGNNNNNNNNNNDANLNDLASENNNTTSAKYTSNTNSTGMTDNDNDTSSLSSQGSDSMNCSTAQSIEEILLGPTLHTSKVLQIDDTDRASIIDECDLLLMESVPLVIEDFEITEAPPIFIMESARIFKILPVDLLKGQTHSNTTFNTTSLTSVTSITTVIPPPSTSRVSSTQKRHPNQMNNISHSITTHNTTSGSNEVESNTSFTSPGISLFEVLDVFQMSFD